MPNFPAVISVANTQVKVAQKSIFQLSGNKLYSIFHKTAVLGNIRVFSGNKTVTFGNTTSTVKTTGQLFP